MDILVERCAALDVHKDIVVACVRLPNPDGGRLQELRAFKATMPGPFGEEHQVEDDELPDP